MALVQASPWRSPNRTPALVISLVLHAALVLATVIVWPWSGRVKPVEVTPVTLLTSQELARLTAAQQADTVQSAQAEAQTEPKPEVTPPAPEPAPTPAPPPPRPQPQPQPQPKPQPQPPPKAEPAPKPVAKAPPAPAPTPKTPAPKTPPPKTPTAKAAPTAPSTPAPKADSFNLDRLAEQLAKDTKAGGPPRANAPRGPARPATDLQARPADGLARATTTTSLSAIQAKLVRLWSPNCETEAGANIVVPIRMSLNIDGGLGKAELASGQSVQQISDPVLRAAAIRALSAVSRGAPYENLPRDDYNYWKTVILNFDAKKACQG